MVEVSPWNRIPAVPVSPPRQKLHFSLKRELCTYNNVRSKLDGTHLQDSPFWTPLPNSSGVLCWQLSSASPDSSSTGPLNSTLSLTFGEQLLLDIPTILDLLDVRPNVGELNLVVNIWLWLPARGFLLIYSFYRCRCSISDLAAPTFFNPKVCQPHDLIDFLATVIPSCHLTWQGLWLCVIL